MLTGRDALRIEVGERALRLRLTRDRLGADVLGFAPTRTQLLANYPNPFNPETWIPFTLAAAGDVVVNVYDVNGRRVRSIALGRLQAGRYSDRDRAAYWDGRNDTGESAASGAYIYELRTEDAREMRRMVIRK